MALYLLITSGLPSLALRSAAVTRAIGVPSTPDNWTLDNFLAVLTPRTGQALGRSLLLALAAASILLVLGTTAAALGRTRWPECEHLDHAHSGTARIHTGNRLADRLRAMARGYRSDHLARVSGEALGAGASADLRCGRPATVGRPACGPGERSWAADGPGDSGRSAAAASVARCLGSVFPDRCARGDHVELALRPGQRDFGRRGVEQCRPGWRGCDGRARTRHGRRGAAGSGTVGPGSDRCS